MINFVQAGLATVILVEVYIIHQNLTSKQARETESRLKWVAGIVSRSMQTSKARKNLGSKKFGGFKTISSMIKKANTVSIPKRK